MFAELLGRARAALESGDPLLIEGEVRVEGDALRVLASSIERLDAVLANGGARAQTRIEVRLRDPAARDSSATCSVRMATAAPACAWCCRSMPDRRWRSTSATLTDLRSPAGLISSAAPAFSAWSISRIAARSACGLVKRRVHD